MVTVFLSVFQWSSGILAIAMVFFMMVLAETLGRKRYRQYAFLSIGQRIAQIILSLILYFFFGILGIVFGYFLGNLIFSYRYLKFIPNFTTQIDSVKEKRNFAFHSYGFNLIRNLTNYLDKLIIAPIFGYYVLGMYQLGFQFFMFLSIIPLSLYYYLLPEESSGKDKRKMKILGFSIAVMASLLAVIAFPYIIETFFPTFVDSIPLVRIMSIAVIPSTIVAMLNATFLGKGKSKTVLYAGLIYIISLITGLITLGQVMGGLGLAITLVTAQTIQAVYLLIKRNCCSP